MTKSKVGAEPKKQRVRHAITKSEGIHEGIHRDEYGYYDSSYHCYCFAYGYFFHRGKGLAEKLTPDTREIKAIDSVLYHTMFPNTQLRIKPDRPNWVETSRGALVPLETAINIFNKLYVDYILSGKTEFVFKYDKFRIGSFYVSRIDYSDKYNDITHYGDKSDFLGYKEWRFRIGCHTL